MQELPYRCYSLATDHHTAYSPKGVRSLYIHFNHGSSMNGDFDRTVTALPDDHSEKKNKPSFKVDRPIVLIGMMGCGKTTVGRRLAARLGVQFLDTDAEIEKAAGLNVSDIFDYYGETDFRDGERRVIQRLMSEHPRILATGGGAFINDETRQLILDKGIAVWLRADLDVLVERTSRRNTRPLLRKGNPRDILKRLLKDREPYYTQAPIQVKTGQGPHESVVQNIIAALRDRYEQ